MNHTKSGIIAHGSPNSIARHMAELRNALENDLCLLLLTDEGRGMAKRFSLCEGCAWSEMTEEGRAEMLKKDHAWKFFTGVAWALETFFNKELAGPTKESRS